MGTVLPAIIPPGKKCSRSISIFRVIQQQVEKALLEVSGLVIIGWSMRESDQQYEGLLQKASVQRKNRLNVMAVCNLHQGNAFYDRFRGLLDAEEFLCCDSGFITQEAKIFLEEVVQRTVLS
ncbi:MAG: hypothetical protein MUP49_07560 [Dehalococcoidia bacterium]|nr:hypothetical protein [Dehalococcoidia bacterium]